MSSELDTILSDFVKYPPDATSNFECMQIFQERAKLAVSAVRWQTEKYNYQLFSTIGMTPLRIEARMKQYDAELVKILKGEQK